jgi:DNA-directed RNA polymerase specialized sigma subunit
LSSNLEIAKKLWPNENFLDLKNKKKITNKIVRIRKILLNKELIEKYNTYKQEKNISEIKKKLQQLLSKNKLLPKKERQTAKEIAEIFGIKESQVNYVSRTIK